MAVRTYMSSALLESRCRREETKRTSATNEPDFSETSHRDEQNYSG